MDYQYMPHTPPTPNYPTCLPTYLPTCHRHKSANPQTKAT